MRRRVIRWFRLAGLLDAAAAADMLAWLNSGFSIDASVRITLIDRDVPSYFQSLEHLLRYCAQSSHIATVGYELYCRLLETAVRGLQKMPPAEPPPVNHVDRHFRVSEPCGQAFPSRWAAGEAGAAFSGTRSAVPGTAALPPGVAFFCRQRGVSPSWAA